MKLMLKLKLKAEKGGWRKKDSFTAVDFDG